MPSDCTSQAESLSGVGRTGPPDFGPSDGVGSSTSSASRPISSHSGPSSDERPNKIARIDDQDELSMELMYIASGENLVHDQPSLYEIYSEPRVTLTAKKMGLGPGWALDLNTVAPDGCNWNFDDPGCRAKALALVKLHKPRLLILSPMCTWFSQIQNINLLGWLKA